MLRFYICDSCSHTFEDQCSMHDPILKVCPQCHKPSLYQDLSNQYVQVYREPSTVGHLAERNTQRAGKYELESQRSKMPKKKGHKTWYNPEGANLSKELDHINTSEKVKKYIMEGE